MYVEVDYIFISICNLFKFILHLYVYIKVTTHVKLLCKCKTGPVLLTG